MPVQKIFCYGEVLLRLSPVLNGHWLKNHQLPVYVGGAELNVATALAGWDIPVQYCTALPDNYLSREMAEYVSARSIDTSSIIWSDGRIGTYYLPHGKDLQHTGVIYDRANSSFAGIKPGSTDWEKLLEHINWLHLSAITPALSEQSAAVCEELLKVAVAKKITVSIDLNYRSRLWQYGKDPVEIMNRLLPYCNVVMGNIWSANTLLGTPIDQDIHSKKDRQQYFDHSTLTAEEIMRQYPACHTVANTFRFDVGEGIEYFACLHTAGERYISPVFSVPKVKDKVGSGDCFMAGLIYGLVHEHLPVHVISFAAGAAFGKLQEIGDATKQTIAQIESLLKAYE
jgi:2-dehydro-3-deoxygluconokinase